MPHGKAIAQACHAVLDLDCKDCAIIVIKADHYEHLMEMKDEAILEEIPYAIIKDAARTVFKLPTVTCGAFGPTNKGSMISLNDCKLY